MKKNIKIGHIPLTVDPQNINITNTSYNSAAVGLRSNSAQVVPTGYSDFSVMINLIFPSIEDINNKLRPIIAISKALPFVPVRSEDIADALVLGSELEGEQTQKDDRQLYEDQVKVAFYQWAEIVYRYYILPAVRIKIQNEDKNPIDILKKAIKVQYEDRFLPIDEVLYNDRNSGTIIADNITQRKWYWNYVLLEGENAIDKNVNYTKPQVYELLGDDTAPDIDIQQQPKYTFIASISGPDKIIDGDTITVTPSGPLGPHIVRVTNSEDVNIRMVGYDSFETISALGKKPDANVPEDALLWRNGQEAHSTTHVDSASAVDYALECKKKLKEFIFGTGTSPINVRVDVFDTDGFDRVVAMITPTEGPNSGKSANHAMLRQGLAIPYVVQKDDAAISDSSFLLAAKEAADSNVGLWNDNLWQGYYFKVSKRYPGQNFKKITSNELDIVTPNKTRGIVTPHDFRRFGNDGPQRAHIGQRLYSNIGDTSGSPANRNTGPDGYMRDGESSESFDFTPETFESVEAMDSGVLGVRKNNYYWDFIPGGLPRRWMPSELHQKLEEAIISVKRESEIRLRGPAHIFASMADSLYDMAIDLSKGTIESYGRIRSKHYPGDYVPLSFIGYQLRSVPELPDAIQATLQFRYFNHTPYVPIFAFMGTSLNEDDILMPNPSVAEIDIARNAAFLIYLEDNYLTDSMDNRQSGRYVRPYTHAEDILLEYQTPTLTTEAKDKETDDVASERTLTRGYGFFSSKAIIKAGNITDGDKASYQVVIPNTLLIGASISLQNNIPQIPLEGLEYPTAQYTGRGQGTAQLVLQTNDRSAIRALHHVRSLSQESARLADSYDLRNATISFVHPLLNITGMHTFVIDNIQEDNDPNNPGLFNITIDLMESSSRYSVREKLNLVKIGTSEDIMEDELVDQVIEEMLVGPPDVKEGLIKEFVGNVKRKEGDNPWFSTIGTRRESLERQTKYTTLKYDGYSYDSIGLDRGWIKKDIDSQYLDTGQSILFGLLPFLFVEGDPMTPHDSYLSPNGDKWKEMGILLQKEGKRDTNDNRGKKVNKKIYDKIEDKLISLVGMRSKQEELIIRNWLKDNLWKRDTYQEMLYTTTTADIVKSQFNLIGGITSRDAAAGSLAATSAIALALQYGVLTFGAAGAAVSSGAFVVIIGSVVSIYKSVEGGFQLIGKKDRIDSKFTTAYPSRYPDGRLSHLAPPRSGSDWYSAFYNAMTNYQYGDYCSKVGQDVASSQLAPKREIDTDTETSSIIYGKDKITIHPYWARHAWGALSTAPQMMDSQITELWNQTKNYTSVDIKYVLRFLFKLSLKFESFKAHFLSAATKHLPHLANNLDGSIMTSDEPDMYYDLNLPTYNEIYGQFHVPNIDARKRLYRGAIRLVEIGREINKKMGGWKKPYPDATYPFKALSRIEVTPLEKDIDVPNPMELINGITETFNMVGDVWEVEEPSKIENVFKDGDNAKKWYDNILWRGHANADNELQEKIDNYNGPPARDQARLQLAWMGIIDDIKRIMSSYNKEENTPEELLPSFRDMGIRGPHAFNQMAKCRGGNDTVNPGWMYYSPKVDIWGQTETTIDDMQKFASEISSIGPDAEDTGSTKELPLRINRESTLTNVWMGRGPASKKTSDVASPDSHVVQNKAGTPVSQSRGDAATKKGGHGQVAEKNAQLKKLARNMGYQDVNLNPDVRHIAKTNVENNPPNKGNKDKPALISDSKKLVSPGIASSPAYPGGNFGTRGEQKKHMKRVFEAQPKYPFNMRFAYPAVAMYFVEEDNETWGYFDDYYRYDSIVSVEVIRDKQITDLAVITLTNMTGILSNALNEDRVNGKPGKVIKSDDTTRVEAWDNTNDTWKKGKKAEFWEDQEDQLLSFRIKQGTRIILKMGYSTKGIDLPTIFTGQVAEISAGPITTIICQAYDYQLAEPLYEEWGRAEQEFPGIICDMLAKVNYFGGYAFYRDRLEGQTQGRGADQGNIDICNGRNWLNSTQGDNLYIEHYDYWEAFNSLGTVGDDWYCGGPMLENLYSMQRYKPHDAMAVLPYDGRSTLYFGPTDGAYMCTSRAASVLRVWATRREMYSELKSSGKWIAFDGALKKEGDAQSDYAEEISDAYESAEHTTRKRGIKELQQDVVDKEEGVSLYAIPDEALPMFPVSVQDDSSLAMTTAINTKYLGRAEINKSKFDKFYANERIDEIIDHIKECPPEILQALLNDLILYAIINYKLLEPGMDYPSVVALSPTRYNNEISSGMTGDNATEEITLSTIAERKNTQDVKIEWVTSSMSAATKKAKQLTETSEHDYGIVKNDISDVYVFYTYKEASLKETNDSGEKIKKYLTEVVRAIKDDKKSTPSPNKFMKEQGSVARLANERCNNSNMIVSSLVVSMDGTWGCQYFPAQVDLKLLGFINYESASGRAIPLWNLIIGSLIPYLDILPTFVANNPESAMARTYNALQSSDTSNLPPNMMPFRDHHLAKSGYNLVSNQIVASRSHMGNIAVVESPGGEPDIESSDGGKTIEIGKAKYIIRASVTHEDELVYPISQYFYDINAYHQGESWQVAMTCLGDALREMYQGQLVILGDPKVKPHDIVNLIDSKNMMNGAFEVKRVVHHFSHESGYLTTINPHMIVHVNRDTDYWTSLGVSAAMFATTVGVTVGVGLLTGGVGSAAFAAGAMGGLAGMSGLPTGSILGISFPWISGQAKIGPSRHNPVRISPLVYKGEPYTVGLEGWEKYAYNPNKSGGSYAVEQLQKKIDAVPEGIDAINKNISRYWNAYNSFRIGDMDYNEGNVVE